jgi:hypothetical protein
MTWAFLLTILYKKFYMIIHDKTRKISFYLDPRIASSALLRKFVMVAKNAGNTAKQDGRFAYVPLCSKANAETHIARAQQQVGSILIGDLLDALPSL